MAQNQPSSAVTVINSDTINIQVPGIITSGTKAAQILMVITLLAVML